MEQNGKSCVIIGNTKEDIFYCSDELTDAVMHLVMDLNIRHFFNDNTSLFQTLINTKISIAKRYCKDNVIHTNLMYKYLSPNIKITTYYNYLTQTLFSDATKEATSTKDTFVLPMEFDDCIYLPDKRMYAKNSITYSAKRIVDMVDYVLVGTNIEDEGHQLTLDLANKLGKPIIKLSDICPKILTADNKYPPA